MRTSSAGSALDIGTTGAGAGDGDGAGDGAVAVAGAGASAGAGGGGAGAGDPRHSIETQVFITSLCQRPPGQPLESEF